MYFIKENNWEVRDTPLYRFVTNGVRTLSDAEILTTLTNISIQQAQEALTHFQSFQRLARTTLAELQQVLDIPPQSAMRLLCAFEIGRRKQEEISRKPRILGAEHVAHYLQTTFADQSQELFVVLFLNRQSEIIAQEVLFKGGVAATIVDSKVIFRAACNHLASAVIVAHNHPSNNNQPSEADKKLTQQLKKAGELLDILVLDHLIITDESYFSFAEEGLM